MQLSCLEPATVLKLSKSISHGGPQYGKLEGNRWEDSQFGDKDIMISKIIFNKYRKGQGNYTQDRKTSLTPSNAYNSSLIFYRQRGFNKFSYCNQTRWSIIVLFSKPLMRDVVHRGKNRALFYLITACQRQEHICILNKHLIWLEDNCYKFH